MKINHRSQGVATIVKNKRKIVVVLKLGLLYD